MKLIAGLGNPGGKYLNTRHNVGFMAVDYLLKSTNHLNLSKSQFKSELYKFDDNLYAKPQTFMNLSGDAIASIFGYYKLSTNDLIVIHDDIDLEFGAIKYKVGGGHGGHNGLRSIDSAVGKDYTRVRIGVGKPQEKSDIANYVLSDFSKPQLLQLEILFEHVKSSMNDLLSKPIEQVSTLYTLKP